MPDQSKAPHIDKPSRPARSVLTAPAVIVDGLRDGAYAEIGWAAEALGIAVSAADREEHPEWFRGPFGHLDGARYLLDQIGWAQKVPPVDVRLDGCGERGALIRALDAALLFAEDDSGGAMKRNPGRTARADASRRDMEGGRVVVLRAFAEHVGSEVARMASSEGGTA